MYNAIMQTPRDISIAEMKDLSDPFNTPGYVYSLWHVLIILYSEQLSERIRE